MKTRRRLATSILLLLTAFIINVPLFFGLNDGRPVHRLLSAAEYFGIFAVLLTLATRSRWRGRIQAIIFLMLMSPCLLLYALEMEIEPWHPFVIGYDLHICGWLGSTLHMLYSAVTGKLGNRNELYRLLLLPSQFCSIILNVILTIILLRFRRSANGPYNNPANWLTIGVALLAGYLLITHFDAASVKEYWYFLLAYIPAYLLLWGIYIRSRRWTGGAHSLLVLILVLLFPMVSILPATINTTTADTVPSFTGAIGVVPMASALPITIVELVRDAPLQELPHWPISIKLYTLLQAGIVFLALPSALAKKRADFSD